MTFQQNHYNNRFNNPEYLQEKYLAIERLKEVFPLAIYLENIVNNPKYSPDFLNDLADNLVYGDVTNADMNTPEKIKQWAQFDYTYKYSATAYLKELQRQQQQEIEQAYRLQGQQENEFQGQFQPQYQNQFPAYGYNQAPYQGYPNAGYQPQQQQQQPPQRPYNNSNRYAGGTQGHSRPDRNEGAYQRHDGQNTRHENQYRPDRTEGGHREEHRPPRNEQNREAQYNNYHINPYQVPQEQKQSYYKSREKENYGRSKKEYSEKQVHLNEIEEKVAEVAVQAPEPEPLPEPVPEPIKVQPPKPVIVSRKYTIQEIKAFINGSNVEELQKQANPEVVSKVKEISGWATRDDDVQVKDDPKFAKKESNKRNDNRNNTFTKGSKYVKNDEAKVAESYGYKTAEREVVQIKLGVNQTVGTKLIKEEIKKKAGQDFTTLKLKEQEGLNELQKARKEIIFNLNLLVPENLKDIEKDLIVYLFNSQEICQSLIVEIIKKAWDQPKYASTYAKLCKDFSNKSSSEFKFQMEEIGNKKEGPNPFKYYLIDRVQHSFDQKIQEFPQFGSPEERELFFKETKKRILSNVKFIAELIISKVLRKKIMKYCISQLIQSFLNYYYLYQKYKRIEDNTYDFYIEAIIEFIQNVGEKYEDIDQSKKEKSDLVRYQQLLERVKRVLNLTEQPSKSLEDLETLSNDDYFKLLAFLDNTIIKKVHPRLSALLQNLVQRRNNKWKKHLAIDVGPKKLKQIQEEEEEEKAKPVQTSKEKDKDNQQKLDKKVKELFEAWEMGKNQESRELRDIIKQNSERSFYLSFLKQVADEKKDKVVKRVQLFSIVLKERFNVKEFRNAWFIAIKDLAFSASDFPFCGAALAKILGLLFAQVENARLEDYFEKFEDEDEEFFMEQVIQKYYNYFEDKDALKFVKPKPKLSGLI